LKAAKRLLNAEFSGVLEFHEVVIERCEATIERRIAAIEERTK